MSTVDLYARRRAGFENRLASSLMPLRQAAHNHGGRIVQATSLEAENIVITDRIATHALPLAIATLETRVLHDETLALMSTVEARFALTLERWKPQREAVVHGAAQERRYL